MTASRDPTQAEMLRAVLDHALSQVHVAIPGVIVAYNLAEQKADIQPQVKGVLKTQGEDEITELPVIPNVPIQMIGGGDYFVSMPHAVGDTGLLVICSSSIDKWKDQGGVVEPFDTSSHRLADAVFLPGVRSFNAPLADANATDMVMGKTGAMQITFKDSADELHLGAATDFVGLAAKMEAGLQNIVNAITNAVVGAADGGALYKTNMIVILNNPVTSVAAAKVKAE